MADVGALPAVRLGEITDVDVDDPALLVANSPEPGPLAMAAVHG